MSPWARRWGPFAWIVLIPVVTIPLTQAITATFVKSSECNYQVDFLGGEASCPDGPVLLALMPGLLNLAPILWLLINDVEVRRNAVIAGGLGAARFAVPMLGVILSGPGSGCPYDVIACANPSGHTVLTWGFVNAFPNSYSVGVSILSAGLWLATLILWIALAIAARSGRQGDSGEKSPAFLEGG